MLLEIPVPERCVTCALLEAREDTRRTIYWWRPNHDTLKRWGDVTKERDAHRAVCRVWLAAHGT